MTQLIDLTLDKKKQQPKKPIEFLMTLNANDEIVETKCKPFQFDFVEILCENYVNGYDLFYAYHSASGRNNGMLFFGRANDKVIS